MPNIVHHYKRKKQQLCRFDKDKSLNHVILGGIIFSILVFLSFNDKVSDNILDKASDKNQSSTRVNTLKGHDNVVNDDVTNESIKIKTFHEEGGKRFWPPKVFPTEKQEGEAKEEDVNGTQIAAPVLYDPPNYDKDQGLNFTNRCCILDDGDESWYPSSPSSQWQLRAPYFLLPGAKKSGTTALSSYLVQHPLVAPARTKELRFFLNKRFRIPFVDDASRKTRVAAARRAMHDADYDAQRLRENPSLVSMDATPSYLFLSAVLPQRILCVAPWIKLVIILRNPVDRVYSNWAYWVRTLRMDPATYPFEAIMQADMTRLEESGFLKAGRDKNEAEEEAAWERYLRIKLEGVVGRSLYEIQLRQWFQAFRDVGRDPSTEVFIVRSEDLKRDIQSEMKKVHAFLGLPHVPVKNEEEKVVSHYSSPMSNETRLELEKFFAPYNEKLYDFLLDHGFGKDWKGYWKPKLLGVDQSTNSTVVP